MDNDIYNTIRPDITKQNDVHINNYVGQIQTEDGPISKEYSETDNAKEKFVDIENKINKNTNNVEKSIPFNVEREHVVLEIYNYSTVNHQTPLSNTGKKPPHIPRRMVETSQSTGAIKTPLDYNPKDRNGFVRIVFSLVFIMLLITSAFIYYVLNDSDVNVFFKQNRGYFVIISGGLMFTISFAISCFDFARQPPCIYILTVLTVMSISCFAATVSLYIRTEVIMLAVVSTAGVVFICTLVAYTSIDFTKCIIFVVIISSALCICSLVVVLYTAITGESLKTVQIIMLLAGTIVEVITIIIELQMILGGKSEELDEDDYVLGAYMLYSSIMMLFLKLLMSLNLMDSD